MGNYARPPANFDSKWVTGPHTRYGHIPWKVGISGVVDRPLRPLLAVSWADRGGVHSPCMHNSRGAMHSLDALDKSRIDIRSCSTEDATGTSHHAILSTSGVVISDSTGGDHCSRMCGLVRPQQTNNLNKHGAVEQATCKSSKEVRVRGLFVQLRPAEVGCTKAH